MSVKTLITDPQTNVQANVIEEGNGENALVVATKELVTYINRQDFFTNDTYGSNLNQDASAGGTPIKIHDGTDNILWTGTSIVGTDVTFNSIAQNHTEGGTKSILSNTSDINDIFQFASGSSIDLNNYVGLSMWVYVDKDWKESDSVAVYGWDTDTGTQVGTSVFLENYFNYLNYDVWQKINIPLSDMQLDDTTTLDAIRFRIITDEGKGMKFYLDDIQFEETGTPLAFYVRPPIGGVYYVTKFMIFIADAYTGTLGDASMPNIPYDSFFAMEPLIGLVLNRRRKQVIEKSVIWKELGDFMNNSNAHLTGYGSDGTNSWCSLVLNFDKPLILDDVYKDYLSINIAEDFSVLKKLKISVSGYEKE